MSIDPDLGQLLAETIAATRGPMRTAIPAEVLAYNPALQTITAKPTVSGRYKDPETGGLVPFPLPAVANVPVAFPSAAGYAITWPLAVGDTVFLVCADRSIDEWKSTGLPENVPLDVRRFDLTDAIAIPGLRPLTSPIPATGWSASALVIEGAQVLLGSSAATSAVALQTGVEEEFRRISVAIVALGGTYSPGVSPAPAGLPNPLLAAATRVKAI